MLSNWRFGALAITLLLAATISYAGAAPEDATALKVELVGGSSSDKDSSDILAALQKLLSALEKRDLDQIGQCLSDDVTVLDYQKRNPIFGKQAALEHIKANVVGSQKSSPVKKLVVHDPFVRVKGDTAMVSFRATKEMANAQKLESWCSEVFERKDGQWLVLQFRSNWKPASSVN